MLKAMFTIDCDDCRTPFDRISATNTDNHLDWLVALDTLTHWAEQSCWYIEPNLYICPLCSRRTTPVPN